MEEIKQIIEKNLAGKITVLTLEKRLKAMKCNLKAFERGKAQIKAHVVYQNKSEILIF
jgi:hypothetical protein